MLAYSATSALCEIPGYNCFSTMRPERRGGGLAIYIKNTIESCTVREDLGFLQNNGCCEILFVELELVGKLYLLGIVYRPPGKDIAEFNAHLLSVLQKCQAEKKKCIIS